MEHKGLTLNDFGQLMDPPRSRRVVHRIMSTSAPRTSSLEPVARVMRTSVKKLMLPFKLDAERRDG